MTGKIVKILGDAYSVAKSLVGSSREVRVDTTNWDLIVHDGATAGGHRILSQENADQRYQHSSAEIGGLSGFGPTDFGFLVRYGPSLYALRTLQSANSDITVGVPDGAAGNPTFTLADAFTNQKTFNAGVVVKGTSDLQGTVSGIGTVHTNLDATGKTLSLDNDQVALSKVNQASLLAYVKTNGVPIGAIMMWSTSLSGAIPAGWALCNGATVNGIVTPNLQDRFIVGAGSSYANGATGGSLTQTPTITPTIAGHVLSVAELANHTHSVTQGGHSHAGSYLPNHAHSITWNSGTYLGGGVAAGFSGGAAVGQYAVPGATDGSGDLGVVIPADIANISIDANGSNAAHGHPGSTATSSAISTLSPYYALCFIMHVGP